MIQIRTFYIAFLLFLIASCSPQKRITRLLNKYPHLVASVDTEVKIKDTIRIENTKIIPLKEIQFSVEKDTQFLIEKDTIFIKGKTVKIKSPADTLNFIDTFYREKIVKVPGKAINVSLPWWNRFYIGALAALLLFGLLNGFRKK